MESTSETVQLKEKSNLTLSKFSKKCVQEVSATSIQKLSTSSSLDSSKLVESQLGNDAIKIMSPGTMELSLRPIVNSPPPADDGNALKNTSLQNEFIAMAIKDEHGNQIGQLMQQNQQKQSVNSSSFVSTVDSGSTSTSLTGVSTAKSSSTMQQTSVTSVVAGIQETSSSSSSMSCSSYSSAQKLESVSSSTKSLSSIKSSQSIERIQKSTVAVVEDQ